MRPTAAAGDPAAAVCRALGLPRSSFYARGAPGADPDLRAALLRLAGAWPTYGYRRLTAMLRRAGHVVDGKRVRRLMHERAWPRRRRPAGCAPPTATTACPANTTGSRAWR